ncbi:cyclin-like protein [Schizothecium vesticola]|uniref:RNA polymerase II holoenzyme cyclin-like subunit n=1 Tax=Schizothecium vesticola TaxID=314040 RepID=A0AA40EJ63_9PEZI|nr:cyclin-like protein [Schizothecium vesticola]
MAANYWESTQRKHWQFTKDELANVRQRLEDDDPGLVQMFPLPQLRHLNIYFNQQINRLGKRLGVRQQPMATAQVYTKRFYTRVEIRRTNPYLVMATAVYLACKMEECPHHIRMVAGEARSLWPNENQSIDASKLGECEFFLISEMSSHLIIHQPYRTLTTLQADFALTQDEASLSWSVINDHYMTDLPLLYPPHVVALTAMLLAITLRPTPGQASASTSGSNFHGAGAALTHAQQARAAMGGSSSVNSSGMMAMPTFSPQSSGGLQSMAAGADGAKPPLLDSRAKVTRFAAWLAESNIDIEAMVDCTQELISFYECHEQYNDKHTREQITRFIKARGL